MAKKDKKNRKDFGRLLLTISGGVFSVYILLFSIQFIFFANKPGWGYKIANVPVTAKTEKEAEAILKAAWEEYDSKKIIIGENSYKIADLVKSVDYNKSYNNVIQEQRNNFFNLSVLTGENYPLVITLNEEEISHILSEEYDKVNKPAADAKIILGKTSFVENESNGQTLLLVETRKNITDAIAGMKEKADLKIQEVHPVITQETANQLLERAKGLASADIELTSKAGTYKIKKEDLISWIKLTPSKSKSLIVKEGFIPNENEQNGFIFFDQTKITLFTSALAKQIDREAVNAQLNIKDNRANIFTPSQTGYKLNQDDLINQILNISESQKKIALDVEVKEPEVREETLNNLGIKELISEGWSDFAGSPKNRIHNFTVGASKFNGVLIKPGEKFSFNKTLGPVDAANGYLPELVILQDKTVPEYGGGMCQVSSTAFRAALNAGLPIVERTPHAYPVVYYKPYGVDATIYLPKPDLVFENDTEGHILIQTKIEGTKIFFDFYGTKPKKTVKFSGNQDANGAVNLVENVTPYIYDQDVRGPKSFTAVFYRHIYDITGKLTDNDKFTSKYDSPDKYPH